jgi:hypothetical protein
MDLFWSGLTERASEHTTINRKSQFSKVFDSVLKDIEMERRMEFR